MILELPFYFTIGGHKCTVRDRILTIDGVVYKIPKRGAEVDKFILWANGLFHKWGEDFKNDPPTLEQIYELIDAIEDRFAVYPMKKSKQQKPRKDAKLTSSPPAPPCWFYNPVYESPLLFPHI